MKEKLFIIILLFISTTSFGRKLYTMTKEDFASQFNENLYLQKVYCQNEKGEKVWLHCTNSTILTISLKDKKPESLMLHTIKLKQGIIEAVKYNVWMPGKKINSFDLSEVVAISIERRFQEYETPYFNIDSVRAITKQKNDSLLDIYSYGSEFVIFLVSPKNFKNDTLKIQENACYNLTFKDGRKTEFGVVQKITEDSIYISNFFNPKAAQRSKKEFDLLGYLATDIKGISLLRSGGFIFNDVKTEDCVLYVENRKKNANNCPYWFAFSPTSGEINFYRLWQTNSGFPGITEINGKATWYEGESTR